QHRLEDWLCAAGRGNVGYTGERLAAAHRRRWAALGLRRIARWLEWVGPVEQFQLLERIWFRTDVHKANYTNISSACQTGPGLPLTRSVASATMSPSSF